MRIVQIRAVPAQSISWSLEQFYSFYRGSELENFSKLVGPTISGIPNVRHHIVEVETDLGITGRYGPIDHLIAHSVIEVGKTCSDLDALSVEETWNAIFQMSSVAGQRVNIAALGAIDCALWDARANYYSTSVGRLLGGAARSKIPCYLSMITCNIDADCVISAASMIAEGGFWGQKWALPDGPASGSAGLSRNVSRVSALRNAIGEHHRLMFEARGCWTPDYYYSFAEAVRPYSVTWIEEPFSPLHSSLYSKIEARPHLPIAAGESASSLDDVWTCYSTLGSVQPDIIWIGGLTPARAVRILCSCSGKLLSPHGRSLFPSLHLACAGWDDPQTVLEYNPILEPQRQDIMGQRLIPYDGHLIEQLDTWTGMWQVQP